MCDIIIMTMMILMIIIMLSLVVVVVVVERKKNQKRNKAKIHVDSKLEVGCKISSLSGVVKLAVFLRGD